MTATAPGPPARPVGVVTRVAGPLAELRDVGDVAMFELVAVGDDELPGEVVAVEGERVTVQLFEHSGGLAPGAAAHAKGMPLSVPLGDWLLGGTFDGLLRPLDPSTTWLRPGRQGAAGTPADESEWWPIRRPRPVRRRLAADEPLVTGQRVLDQLFPVAKGSTAAVVGGFGTGKTMLLAQIAKWCDADVIVYVGCGERGNELADAIEELGSLEDPRTGRRLAERTVIIANTSNMPVMAREASIHTGMTVAEHFRDEGKHAVLIADSTSRWAEALREFSSRRGELPAEEGFPAELSSALASFYERAGRVETLDGAEGSVTVVAAVSPPGGDTTEPVSAHTQRFVRTLWVLDRDLAYARHYPAVSWQGSFSRDAPAVGRWHARHRDAAWAARRGRLTSLLAEADHLESVAQLVGTTALPGRERVVLLAARLARGAVLQQSALSDNDASCSLDAQAALAEAVLAVHDRAQALVRQGRPVSLIESVDLGPLLHAGPELRPDDVAGIVARRDDVLARIEDAT